MHFVSSRALTRIFCLACNFLLIKVFPERNRYPSLELNYKNTICARIYLNSPSLSSRGTQNFPWMKPHLPRVERIFSPYSCTENCTYIANESQQRVVKMSISDLLYRVNSCRQNIFISRINSRLKHPVCLFSNSVVWLVQSYLRFNLLHDVLRKWSNYNMNL